MCNLFLRHKEKLVEVGELSPLTWNDYKTACAEIIREFGSSRLLADVGPDDFTPLRAYLASPAWCSSRVVVIHGTRAPTTAH